MKQFETLTISSVSVGWTSTSRYAHSVFAFASGYESRSLSLLRELIQKGDLEEWTFCGFSFNEFVYDCSRPENDQFLLENEIECIILNSRDATQFIGAVRQAISEAMKIHNRIRLVVDYSSMPRNWYCSLMVECLRNEWIVDSEWMYSAGVYSDMEYPCVGYGDFKRFLGWPNAGAIDQVHIFGLGFDSIRTYGIWNYLDPQRSLCLIASSVKDMNLRELVRQRNTEIMGFSMAISEFSLDSFPAMLASIVEIVRQVSAGGDVALVPDGPKPLVLAMSIIPVIAGTEGVFCWHVGHVKPHGYKPLDVQSSGDCYSFRVTSTQ